MKVILLSLAFVLTALAFEAEAAPAQQGTSAPSDLPAGAAAGVDAEIRPGDQISLRILREPELGGVFTVPEDGEVVFPKLGSVYVADLRIGALEDSLRTDYGVYLRDPVVEVSVLRRIGVHGEVRQPNIYMVDLTVTLRDLIAQAGGVTQAGDPNDITIIRDGERIQVDQGRTASFTTAELRSGDQVVVGRRGWMALNPAVAVSTGISLISFIITMVLLADDKGS